MSLQSYGAREFDSLHDRIEEIFAEVFGDSPPSGARSVEAPPAWVPAVDLYEGDDCLIICAELPGLDREDIQVQLDDDTVTISGERRRLLREGERLRRAECPQGLFRRNFVLGMRVDPESVTATYTNGVLEVRLPRAGPTQPKVISLS